MGTGGLAQHHCRQNESRLPNTACTCKHHCRRPPQWGPMDWSTPDLFIHLQQMWLSLNAATRIGEQAQQAQPEGMYSD